MGEYSAEHAALGLFAALGTGCVLALFAARRRLGQRGGVDAPAAVDCGVPPGDSPRPSAKLYRIAILLIVFDVGLVLLYPWAIVMRDMGGYGLVVALPFLAAISVGLAYEWLKGGLEWE